MNKFEVLVRLTPKSIKRIVPESIKELVLKRRTSSLPTAKSLIERYCRGHGLEVGPGKNPYGDPKTTIFMDKHTNNEDGMPNPDLIGDAAKVPVPNSSFDYLISSHCLEHCQNTLKVLQEWIRVLKTDGILFLILPHGDRTLDMYRNKTTLSTPHR